MANLQFEVPFPAIQNAIQGSKAIIRLQDPTPLYKAWGNYLEELAVDAYQSESAPFGSGWPALKPATLARKTKTTALRETNQLYDSTVAQVLPDGAQIGSNLAVGKYSLLAIHQYGAPRANIPARRVLPIDADGDLLPQVEDELFALTEDYLFG
jgi:phage gpG-like protein